MNRLAALCLGCLRASMGAKHLLVGLLGVLLAAPVLSEDKTVYLASLEWPPYAGKALRDQGASVAVAKAAFKAMGYELVVDFYPWSRAVYLAKDEGSKYAGYFPEYYSEDVAATFAYSDVMGTGPLGFAQRADKPVSWSSLDDLAELTIGVVRDYVNTPEFDKRMADGRLRTEAVGQDKNNLQKLVAGRLDLVVIDKHVMNYLFENDPELKGQRGKVSFNSRLLEDKKLFVCFKRDGKGEDLRKIFNEGLKKIDVEGIMAGFLK